MRPPKALERPACRTHTPPAKRPRPACTPDQVGARRSTASSLRAMEPEPEVAGDGDGDPDLDAIARDLAAVEDTLARLADGTYRDDEHEPPAAP